MFFPKSRQSTFFDLDNTLPEKMQQRIKKTWAEIFLRIIYPLLLEAENDYKDFYCNSNGAANTPVALLLGILILKEMFDLTNEETLEQLEYNILWQYALDIPFEQAHVSRKTLHNFRVKIIESKRHHKLFEKLTKKIIEIFSLKTNQQRLDSTHIVSNMKKVGRLGLFIQVLEQFLFKLKRMAKRDKKIAKYLEQLPERFHKNYLEREGYFGDTRNSEASRKLQGCAEDILFLLQLFEKDQKIANLKQFKTLIRLFEEQCEIVKDNEKLTVQNKEAQEIEQKKDGNNFNKSNTANKQNIKENSSKKQNQCSDQIKENVELKDKKQIPSSSLQSASDTDATYGYKGKGYSSQIAETCNEDNPFEVITHNHTHGANESDQTKTISTIDELAQTDLLPDELFVDAGYVSGENIVQAQEKGTSLIGPLPGKASDPSKLTLEDFTFDKKDSIDKCPNGFSPIKQGNSKDGSSYAQFSTQDCADCPLRNLCPVQGKHKRHLKFNKAKRAIDKRKKEIGTKEFKEKYKIRSGIEATNSEIKHKHGAARLKVRGLEKIDFTMVIKSLALNIKRMFQYVVGKIKQLDTNLIDASFTAIISLFLAVFAIFRCKIMKFSFHYQKIQMAF